MGLNLKLTPMGNAVSLPQNVVARARVPGYRPQSDVTIPALTVGKRHCRLLIWGNR
ncbi:hypothetical protein H6F71_20115 [Microcoleus sp. FACHB-61]|nr:hypothetical protein [Microcoleus sp. FACHB-61]